MESTRSGKAGQPVDLQAEFTRLLSDPETRRELTSSQAFQEIIKEALAQLASNAKTSAEVKA